MATTTPDNIYSPDAGQQYALTQDLLANADSVQAALNTLRAGRRYRTGTAADRTSWSTPGEGALFYNSDSRKIEVYQSGTWLQVWPPTRVSGRFVGATSGTGTATVNHGLPGVPSYVGVTDTVAGAVPGSRMIKVSATSSTQIQFVVYYGDAPLAGNPVEFYWEAYL